MEHIRLAIIGLSSTAVTSWAAEGHLPYLLSERGRSHYEIVALLNSSDKAAEAAKAHFRLPATVRTYGNAAELAADEAVDLVVVNTRVDTHAVLARAALEAGKPAFVEWPIAESAAVSRALLDPGTNTAYAAALKKSVVGLQGRVAPIITKLKTLLDSGRLGKVLSSEARVYGNLWRRDALSEGLAYFAERRIGGSGLTITYAHAIDYIMDVLGDIEPRDIKSTSSIQRPAVAVLGAENKPTRTVQSDVPDFLALHGPMFDSRGRGRVSPGAPLAVTMRNGPPFKGQPAFVWTINAEKGEIRLISESGPYIFSGMSYDVRPRILVHDHAVDEVTEVQWEWEDWQTEIGLKARATGEVYERYAKWWARGQPAAAAGELPEEEDFPRLLDAQRRMDHLETILKQFDAWEA